MSWGDNSAARPVTDKYREEHDRLFGRKGDTVVTDRNDSYVAAYGDGWIKFSDQRPTNEEEIIAVGELEGEVSGRIGEICMAIGTWDDRANEVVLQTDIYYTLLVNPTVWRPTPSIPKETEHVSTD